MTHERPRLLGLPVESRLIAGASTLGLFAFYFATMSRSLSLYDSPELAMVAEQFGLGHPLGQPLHTLIGGLVSRLPGIEPLIALNGLSALGGALSVIPATSLAQTLIHANQDLRPGEPRIVAPTVALLGTFPVLWEPATRIEVYPLAVFLGLWAAARFAAALAEPTSPPRAALTTGVALGLSASANPVCAFGAALGIFPSFAFATARRRLSLPHLGRLVLGGVVGLLPYSYVFIVASREDVVVWGAPTDAESIGHYFSAADFTPKQVTSAAEWLSHIGDLLRWGSGEILFVPAAVLALGGYVFFRKPYGIGLGLMLISFSFFVAFIARNGTFAPDVLDYLGYLALPVWISAAGLALIIARVAARRLGLGAVALGVLAIIAFELPPGLNERTRRADRYTETLAYEALKAAPSNAVTVVEQDHWVGPMWYLQEQLGVRSDVIVLAYGLTSSSWYWSYLFRRHPALHEFELLGSGGRTGRVRRFLQANSELPIQIERVRLAHKLDLPTCPNEWLFDVKQVCDETPGLSPLIAHAAEALDQVKDGSPGTPGLIAKVTLDRGHDLLVHGKARAAVETMLAGVPKIEALEALDLSSIPEDVKGLRIPPPAYGPPAALGHPARNAHYASLIARATGAKKLAAALETLAKDLGPVQPKFTSPTESPANL